MNEALIWWLVLFAGMSGVVVAAGVLLAKSGDRIADKTVKTPQFPCRFVKLIGHQAWPETAGS